MNESAGIGNKSRSRSSGINNNVNINNEPVGFRMSLKNINKASRDEDLI